MASIKSAIATVRRTIAVIQQINIKLDQISITQGTILAELHDKKQSRKLEDYEYKIFSQWGEDGIIQRLVNVIPIKNKTFIEFGVEDFFESNCRYLLMKDNWRGFVIDSSPENIRRLKSSYFYWRYDLIAIEAFITKENINELLARSGFSEDLGILSIDMDGNDYHILEAIETLRPRLLICEYNAVFGRTRKISVPYDSGFARTEKQHSNLYYGASLAAMAHLAGINGYSMVGTNTANSNAFFVRNDLLNEHVDVISPNEAFAPSRFRESLDDNGDLSHISGEERGKLIQGLPVWNVEANVIETL
jgi:hypothetical protein